MHHCVHTTKQGRWISPDPAGMGAVSLANPQTWNRYAYVANGPLNAVDPTGLSSFDDNLHLQRLDAIGSGDGCFVVPGCSTYYINGIQVPDAVGAAYAGFSNAFFNCTSNCDKLVSGQQTIGARLRTLYTVPLRRLILS
jgi:uncharacterized protein RhaS with RHS repeats